MTTPAPTCKRGHERNAENTRERTVVQNERTYIVHECQDCRRERAREKREARRVG